ncbi:MAG: Smr/MutS family protein [Thermoflavifilum sp.]|nr:Smr/MutS family protein [Thermoflavifilum sp.]
MARGKDILAFEPGDAVWLKHSGERGIVTDILGDGMLEVEVEGIRFPVFADQVEHPYFAEFSRPPRLIKRFIPGEELPVEKPRASHTQKADEELPAHQTTKHPSHATVQGVWLQFFPEFSPEDDESLVKLKIFLVNHTPQDYRMQYRLLKQGCVDFNFQQDLRSYTQLYLHDIQWEDFNDKPVFSFEMLKLSAGVVVGSSRQWRIRFKAQELVGQLERLKEQGLASFSKLIFERFSPPPGSIADAGQLFSITESKESHHRASSGNASLVFIFEIDLHAEALGISDLGWPSWQVLEYQMQYFRQHLDRAIAQLQPHLKVIHGVGQGVLREKVHEELRRTPEVARMVCDVNPGETMIYFTYR